MKSLPPFSAAILTGGKSARFGQNKALFVYREKPLLEWVRLSLCHASELFAVGSTPMTIPTYPDLIPGGGSLSGLHTALSYAREDWVAVAACDLPFLSPEYWNILLEHTKDTQIVIAENNTGRPEPLATLYHRSLLPIVEAQLECQDFKLTRLGEKVSCTKLSWREFQSKCNDNIFLNANYRHDLI